MSAPLTIKGKLPRLNYLLRWLERVSPPKMMLSLAANGQLKTSIPLSESNGLLKGEEGDGWNYRPTIVRVTRRARRGQRV